MKPYPTYVEVFENRTKTRDKIVLVLLLAGLAVNLIAAALLHFGVITIGQRLEPTPGASSYVLVSAKSDR